MSSTVLFSFWAYSLLFVFTPGADWTYAISAGIRGKGVMAAVSGLLAGYVVLTLIVAAGFGGVVVGNRPTLAILTLVGALYLGWLGVTILRNPPVPRVEEVDTPETGNARLFLRGALVSGLNPKAFLFFLAVLPPWTNAEADWSISTQMAVLGLVYTVSCSVIYSMVGLGASVALRARPSAARAIGRISGVVMLVLAVLLICRESVWLG